MHAYLYTCAYICVTHISAYVHTYLHLYAPGACIHTHVRIHAHIPGLLHRRVHVYIRMHALTYKHPVTYTHADLNAHTLTYIRLCSITCTKDLFRYHKRMNCSTTQVSDVLENRFCMYVCMYVRMYVYSCSMCILIYAHVCICKDRCVVPPTSRMC